jgi:hypothetical protein
VGKHDANLSSRISRNIGRSQMRIPAPSVSKPLFI